MMTHTSSKDSQQDRFEQVSAKSVKLSLVFSVLPFAESTEGADQIVWNKYDGHVEPGISAK